MIYCEIEWMEKMMIYDNDIDDRDNHAKQDDDDEKNDGAECWWGASENVQLIEWMLLKEDHLPLSKIVF